MRTECFSPENESVQVRLSMDKTLRPEDMQTGKTVDADAGPKKRKYILNGKTGSV